MTTWTQNEIRSLKREYKKEYPNLKRLEKLFNRHNTNISRKAKELGLGTRFCRKKPQWLRDKICEAKGWPKENNKKLLNIYNDYTNKELASKFKCSESSIERRLKRFGLKKDFKKRGWIFRNGHPRGFSGYRHSEKVKIESSKRAKRNWANPDSFLNSEEYRNNLSDRAVKMQKEKIFKNRYSRCKAGKRKDLGIYVRSSWEANFARYLNWSKERGDIQKWEYEADTFDFPVKRGTRFYTPDFKVFENDGSIVYYEVKGWMTQKGQTALNRMEKYYPEIKIILFNKDSYRELTKLKRMFPNWE